MTLAKIAKYLDETNRVLNFFDRSIEPEKGDKGYSALSCEIKNIDHERHAIEAVLSSDAVDRYGEVVDPKGFEPFLERFNENPQLLYCHDHQINLGHWEKMKITKHTFEGWAVFDDEDEFAMKIFRKYRNKNLRAFSVGFIAHEWEMEQDKKSKRMRRRFTLQEPIEGTACTVPANPFALSKSLQKINRLFGIDVADKNADPYFMQNGMDTTFDPEALKKALEQHITKVLTDPLGPVDGLIREVVAAVQAGGSCGHDHNTDEPHDPDVGEAAIDGDALARTLRDIAGNSA